MPGPAKIYDRPERTGPSPLLLIVILLVVVVAGYFLYRAFYHPAANRQPTGMVIQRVLVATGPEIKIDGELQQYAYYR